MKKRGEQMKNEMKVLMLLGIVLLTIGMASASSSASTVMTVINTLLCRLLQVLWGIAAAVAIIVIVLAGIKWIGSAEDAGARAQAKSTIVHAIIGLLIVMIALTLVGWVVQGSAVAMLTC
jgi:type IV secretory pathway VirB2 component (pilin)